MRAYISGDREHFEWTGADGEKIKKDFALTQSLLDFLDVDFVHVAQPEHVYFEAGAYIKEEAWMWQNQVRTLISKALDAQYDDNKTVQQRLADFSLLVGMDWFKFEPIATRFERLDENSFGDVLYSTGVHDLLNFFLREIIRREITFKTCRCCGRYFPSYVHGNSEYCDRVFQDGKTCKDVGAVAVFRGKLAESPAMQLYQRAYKTRFARIKAGKLSKDAFTLWGEQARLYRDRVLAGEMAFADFEAWVRES